MAVTTNNVWSRVLQNIYLQVREDDMEAIESRVELTVENSRRKAYDCQTGRYCRLLASPKVRFDELVSDINELMVNMAHLTTVASPLCAELVSLYVTQSYTDVQRLIRFASIHLRNMPNIAKAVVDTVKSLEKVMIDLKKIVIDKLKKLIEDVMKKIARILKDFISSNKAALGTTALGVPFAITARTIAGSAAFVGQRALTATSVVAAVAIPIISVGAIAYKEYNKRKRLRQMEIELANDAHCYGIKDVQEKLISTANEFRELARQQEMKNKTELALVYIRGDIKIREIIDSLTCDDCKCFSEGSHDYS